MCYYYYCYCTAAASCVSPRWPSSFFPGCIWPRSAQPCPRRSSALRARASAALVSTPVPTRRGGKLKSVLRRRALREASMAFCCKPFHASGKQRGRFLGSLRLADELCCCLVAQSCGVQVALCIDVLQATCRAHEELLRTA